MPRLSFSRSEEGLLAALHALARARGTGDRNGEGEVLLALSQLVKWVRSDNEESPFNRAETLALEALQAFRASGNEHDQVRALISAISPFNKKVLDERLAEAERLARKLGDRELIADVVAAKARGAGLADREAAKRYALQALELYRELGDTFGMAGCHFSLSIALGEDAEKRQHAIDAFHCYRAAGNKSEAGRALSLAQMNCNTDEEYIALEPLFKVALDDAQESGHRSNEKSCYLFLGRIAEKKGDLEEALTYKRWEAELAAAEGGTPLEKWERDVEMTEMLIAFAQANGDQEGASSFRAELKRLKKSKPKR